VDQLVMQDSLEEKSLPTLMVDGLGMEEELFQEKIHLKSIDQLPMLLVGLLKV
jgi:hypothetical protein